MRVKIILKARVRVHNHQVSFISDCYMKYFEGAKDPEDLQSISSAANPAIDGGQSNSMRRALTIMLARLIRFTLKKALQCVGAKVLVVQCQFSKESKSAARLPV
jgi:hypothetical protein